MKIHYFTLTLGLRSHKMLPSSLYIEMHLQENTLFDLGVKVIQNVRFRMRCIYKKIHYLKVTQGVAQYPLHHVTFSGTKFEVATSNGLGGDTFTKQEDPWALDRSPESWHIR